MKKSNKAIIVGKGEECPKCFKEMEHRKHPDHWESRKSYFYTEWDYCPFCKHVQHYEKFKSLEWLKAEQHGT
jgi:hypothetical protein